MYQNICTKYELEVLKSKWEMPLIGMFLRDFWIQTDKLQIANEADIVVIDKLQKKAVVIDLAIPSDTNIE